MRGSRMAWRQRERGREREQRGRRIRLMPRMMREVTWKGMQKSLLSPSFVWKTREATNG
jgi:hypothetical protein